LSGNFRNEIRLRPWWRKKFSAAPPETEREENNLITQIFQALWQGLLSSCLRRQRRSDMFSWQNKFLIVSIESAEGKIEMEISLVRREIRLNRAQFGFSFVFSAKAGARTGWSSAAEKFAFTFSAFLIKIYRSR
jgi:hypothetical protein